MKCPNKYAIYHKHIEMSTIGGTTLVLKEWDPIGSIPLERAHIWTLHHTEIHILDKLLDLSIGHVWSMKRQFSANTCIQ